MKKTNSKSSILGSLTAIVIVGGLFVSSQVWASPIVSLKVNADQTALEYYRSSGMGCRGRPPEGEICVPAGLPEKLTFKLRGDVSCEAGGDWIMHQVVLAPDTGDKPASDADWGGLTAAQAADFGADPATGVAANVDPTTDKKLTINNQNKLTQSYWYKVTAKCGDTVIKYDPRIRNGGGGQR